tara:strand:- start:8 stop:517 length:510 start_codon:yes stop_codon:yes gene_type:complete
MGDVKLIVTIFGVLIGLLAILRFFPFSLFAGSDKEPATKSFPYQSKVYLLSKAERSFLGVLEQVVGANYRIMVQVRLADVIEVKGGTKNGQGARNRIQSKHLDFVACDPNDLSIKFAVELDDSTHKRADRQERDAFLDQAMKAAGVPLYRFKAKPNYAPQQVRQKIFGQ